jgi:hypothetical protein
MKEMGWAGHVSHSKFWCVNYKERDHSEDLHISGRIFKWV